MILGTNNYAKVLIGIIHRLPDLVPEEDYIVQFVMDSIKDENDAMLALSYNSMEMVHDAIGSAYDADVAVTANAVVQFGTAIFLELQRLQAYRNGRLTYQFLRWLGNDIILAREDLYKAQDRRLLTLAGVGQWL